MTPFAPPRTVGDVVELHQQGLRPQICNLGPQMTVDRLGDVRAQDLVKRRRKGPHRFYGPK